jgi:hypothetical protein
MTSASTAAHNPAESAVMIAMNALQIRRTSKDFKNANMR